MAVLAGFTVTLHVRGSICLQNVLIWKLTFIHSRLGILAIGLINEALDEGDAHKTLQALQIPAAKLEGVLADVAQHYQDTLIRAKREKAQVGGTA